MENKDQFDAALKQYSESQGISITLHHGASVLTTSGGVEIWLESQSDNPLAIFHTQVMDKAAFNIPQHAQKRCLEINSDFEITQGAWLGLHPDTDTLRLCAAVPREYVTAELIDAMVGNLSDLSIDFYKKHIF